MFGKLSLNGKVTLTLVGAFVLIVGVFLLILFPFQQNQLQHLYDLHKSAASNLVRAFHNRILYDLYGEMDESLMLDLQGLLAGSPSVLYVRIVDQAGGVYATTDPVVVRRAYERSRGEGRLEEDARVANVYGVPIRPVLVVRRGRPARIHGIGGRSYVDRGPSSLDELFDRVAGEMESTSRFERGEVRGVPAFVETEPLEAAGRLYGRMQIAYSLAAVERIRRQTLWIFGGLIASMFIIVLLLLNLLMARIIIAPLRVVYRAMREAGRGDLRQRLEERSSDEIGMISSIFNRMVEKLAASKGEIERYSRDLERMVSERTEALRRSREDVTDLKNYLAAVIESVGAGVLCVDREGRISTFNERAGELLHTDPSGVEGRPVRELLGEGRLGKLGEVIVEAERSGGESFSREVEVRLVRGRRTLSVNVTVLTAEDGRDLGRVVIFDDITRLIYSKKLMAWKEAVEKVIHEIKNPLTPIRLSTQQLRAAFQDDSADFPVMFERGTRNILASVDNLQKLVTDFSHFYSLRPPVLGPQRINVLVEEVLSMYSGGLPEGVRLERDLAAGVPPIQADADHLKRVIANLVRNGIEAMEGRRGVLSVRTEYRREEGRIALIVRDEGRGIGPEEQEKIFEPYYTTKIKGTGLGLIISKQIVEEHGGSISIESELDRGTTFEVLLPAGVTERPG